MQVRDHKTKVVGTIGPASESPEMLERLIRAGLDVARLNFSHGDFSGHKERIAKLRTASERAGRAIAILADLPGPKMRLGTLQSEPIDLHVGDPFVLTAEKMVGDSHRCSMSFEALPRVVKPGDRLFLNDGLVHLTVERIEGNDVHCTVSVGGELRSRKGLNLPGIDLGITAFTDHDRACLKFALENGVDAVSQSFVQNARDVELVRESARSLGYRPFIVAKIERVEAVRNYDEILAASDGIMVARGDLGIEVPMEEIAVIQKQLIAGANSAGKPVITATQMLESMINNRLPTRAECTDVANAILDGTDCVMLSGECAVGQYPVEAVTMLGKIAAATEPHRHKTRTFHMHEPAQWTSNTAAQAMGILVEHALETAPSAAVFVPTKSGDTARMISRFKPSVWIVALGLDEKVCRHLKFSYGVEPVFVGEEADDWRPVIYDWLRQQKIPGKIALLVAAASTKQPDASHRIEFLRVPESTAAATS